MQVGSVFVKVVERKLQSNSSAFQYMILAGFDPKLTHRTATYVETLGAESTMNSDLLDKEIEKARVKCSAKEVVDLTTDSTMKRLMKAFEMEGLVMA